MPASACVMTSANSFSEILSHTLKKKLPPGLNGRRASFNPLIRSGKNHRAELAGDRIETLVGKRQSRRIGLLPLDALVVTLPRPGVVEHRLVEIGRRQACSC